MIATVAMMLAIILNIAGTLTIVTAFTDERTDSNDVNWRSVKWGAALILTGVAAALTGAILAATR